MFSLIINKVMQICLLIQKFDKHRVRSTVYCMDRAKREKKRRAEEGKDTKEKIICTITGVEDCLGRLSLSSTYQCPLLPQDTLSPAEAH